MNIVLIPARGGSKRVKDKNLQIIGEHSMVGHAVNVGLELERRGLVDGVYVSSDSDSILLEARKYGAKPVKRSDGYASSDSAGDRYVILDFLASDCYKDSMHNGEWFDELVYLRPTSPFRTVDQVEKAINRLRSMPFASALRSIHEMSESAYKCHEISCGLLSCPFLCGSSGEIKYNIDMCNSPNQDYPKTYQPNGIVDIIKCKTFASGMLFGRNVIPFITEPTIEIDTEFDLTIARLYQKTIEEKKQ